MLPPLVASEARRAFVHALVSVSPLADTFTMQRNALRELQASDSVGNNNNAASQPRFSKPPSSGDAFAVPPQFVQGDSEVRYRAFKRSGR